MLLRRRSAGQFSGATRTRLKPPSTTGGESRWREIWPKGKSNLKSTKVSLSASWLFRSIRRTRQISSLGMSDTFVAPAPIFAIHLAGGIFLTRYLTSQMPRPQSKPGSPKGGRSSRGRIRTYRLMVCNFGRCPPRAQLPVAVIDRSTPSGPRTDVEVPAWDRFEADFRELFRLACTHLRSPRTSYAGNVNCAESR
jgi:hypothetical protein